MRGLLVVLAFLSAVGFAPAQPAPAQSAQPAPPQSTQPEAVQSAQAAPPPHPNATAAVAWARAHRPVSTTNPEAQRAFDEGLTMLYAFNPQEARKAFERTASADPQLAMAYWGIAMSYGININISYDPAAQHQGHDAIVKAQARASDASPAEKALIGAADRRFAHSGKNDGDASARAYADAMHTAAAQFAGDDDVLTLAAEASMDTHPWGYWDADGKPQPGTPALVRSLQTVLARNATHIGANHLLIHALEASPHPEGALDAAHRLETDNFEPAAEHLAHMPAHTFMRTGAYHAAGEANVRALNDFQRYDAGPHASEHDAYHGHDCLFGVDAFMMSGEHLHANETAARCGDAAHRYAGYVAVRFRRWPDLAAYAGETPFLRGMSAVAAGRFSDAQAAVHELEAQKQDTATIAADVLRAKIAAAKGDRDAEIAALEKAVREQDALGYSEPPPWFYPVRETLGAAYFRAGRYPEAERTFRTDLSKNPRNPRSLYGLSQTLVAEGRSNDAATAKHAFSLAWENADVTLTMSDL